MIPRRTRRCPDLSRDSHRTHEHHGHAMHPHGTNPLECTDGYPLAGPGSLP